MNDVTQAMSHSTLMGGSIAGRRIECPRSYTLEQMVPKDKGSIYARQGTALHEMMARILGQGQEAADLLPFEYTQEEDDGSTWTYTVTEDDWEELGQVALDMLDTFIDQMEDLTGEPFQMYIEQSCDYPGVEGAKGTSDLIWRCGVWGGIWDWKFGRGYVGAYMNKQLMFYLYAAIGKFPEFFKGVEWWGVAISQPQISPKPSFWDLTEADLGEFNRQVHAALGHMKAGIKAPIKAGDHCKFARCKAICPLQAGAAVELGKMMAQLEEEKTMVNFDLPAYLAQAMELAEMAEDWAKQVAGVTQQSLENGAVVPRWKLVPKKSSGKEWTEEEEIIEARLKEAGLPETAIIKRSLVTPTQAIAAAKKAKVKMPVKKVKNPDGTEEEIDYFVQKPSSGSTLTREDDPRPSVRRTSEEAVALGAALLATLKPVVGDTEPQT
jgi:Protein of unknown function (DUF2800)